MREAIHRGATIVKLKVGKGNVGNLRNFRRDIEVIRHAVDPISSEAPRTRLVADANQGCLTPEMNRRLCGLERGS